MVLSVMASPSGGNGAVIAREDGLDRHDACRRARTPMPRVVDLVAIAGGGQEVLAPRLHPLHRPAEAPGHRGHQDLLGIDVALDAEAAAHVGHDDADRAPRAGRAPRRCRCAPRTAPGSTSTPSGRPSLRIGRGQHAARLDAACPPRAGRRGAPRRRRGPAASAAPASPSGARGHARHVVAASRRGPAGRRARVAASGATATGSGSYVDVHRARRRRRRGRRSSATTTATASPTWRTRSAGEERDGGTRGQPARGTSGGHRARELRQVVRACRPRPRPASARAAARVDAEHARVGVRAAHQRPGGAMPGGRRSSR